MTGLSCIAPAPMNEAVLWQTREVVHVLLSMTAPSSKLWVALSALSLCLIASGRSGVACAQALPAQAGVAQAALAPEPADDVTPEPVAKPAPRRIELQA